MKVTGILILALAVILATAHLAYSQELDLYGTMQDRAQVYNAFVERQGAPPGFDVLTDARVNLIVDSQVVGLVIDGGKIVEVVKGGIDDPTNEFKTTGDYFDSILTSDDPAKRVNFGLKQAFIMKRDHGLGGGAKGKIAERLLNKLDVPEPKTETKVDKEIGEVATGEKGEFAIEGSALGLKRTDLELKSKEDIGDKKILIEEYNGYTDVAPHGLKPLDLKEGEGNLGTYIKVETPGVKFEEFVLRIAYKDEELDYKFLDEQSLTLKLFDSATGNWIILREGTPDWVKEINVDTENNIIIAHLEHASVYGISGQIIDVNKLQQQRNIEPVYFVSREEVDQIRAAKARRGIIDRIIDFILGLFLK